MKMEARGRNKAAKYCEDCQENFGDGFSFCPVCGEPLKTVQVKQTQQAVVPQSANSQIQPEEVATVVSTIPVSKNIAQTANQPTVERTNEPIIAQEKQNGSHEVADAIIKLVVPVKQPTIKAVERPTAVGSKSFKPSLVVAIAIAAALVLGVILELMRYQNPSLETINSISNESAPRSQTDISAKEELSPQNVDKNLSETVNKEILAQSVADAQATDETVLQTAPSENAEELDKDQGLNIADPIQTVPTESKTTKQPQARSIVMLKPVPNLRLSKNLSIKRDLSKQPKQIPFEERAVKYKNQKRSGAKSFFGKIGSGLLYIPKILFKKRK